MWGAWPGYRPAAVAAVPRWVSAGILFVIVYQPPTVAAGSCRQAWTLLKWRCSRRAMHSGSPLLDWAAQRSPVDAVDAAMNLADQHLRGQVRRNGDCQAEHGCQVALIAAKQPSGSPAGPTASTGSDTSRTPSTTR
jgi:hypothetical protein